MSIRVPPVLLVVAVACWVGLVTACAGKTKITITQTATATVLETVAPPAGATLMPRRDGELVYRPSMIGLSDTDRLSDVHWSSFGKRRAVGRGTYYLNLCEPTCATAPREKVTAEIEVQRPMPCRGHLAYTIITIEGPGMKVRNEPISLVINATRPACA